MASEALALQQRRQPQEALVLEFADEAKLYVPLEQAYLVSRYVGVGKKSPALSSLGDAKWTRAKKNAAASIFDYAGKMLAVQAERQMHPGHAFAPDTKWQAEFEHSFPFRETPDQLKAIIDTKIDMERRQPMDRLICGDVGFGKTEVAIRAAFKAVMDGKQVAVLAPTTVLAQQHFEVFRQRMLDYPVRIEMLSRFRSQGEQKKILELLRKGGVDIVIGTHRLISGDVVFKDLGLVVIDEEQRFGVLHKEKFKELFKLVDVLTLSATPIPRTLYLSLVGVKDMSTIETPPLNRLPVETMVSAYDERIIRDAINRELERQGQVFFLHNRVQTIERARDRIVDLCPQARVEIGHGQMGSDELESVMARFIAGKVDVLVCTTIIESGLDIPNANTIIIDRADRFGLADLYQLRGRVGRAEHKAYAYLLLPREMMTIGAARKRINAIRQYSSLGAGFRIAMRDLEIRGAGSILGTAQSGHIMAVGFDLYCQLLKQAVAQLKGEKVQLRLDVDLRLDFVATNEAEFVQQPKSPAREADSFPCKIPAFIPNSFISDATLRIKAYREIAEITAHDQLDRLRRDWRDRFGPFPAAVDNLFLLIEIKLAAAKSGVSRVEVRERKLMLTRHEDFILVAGKFPRLVARRNRAVSRGNSGVDEKTMRHIMRWFAIASLAASGPALLPLCCAAFGAEPEVINGIAAVVNGDVITYSQVRELSAPREKLLRSQYTGEELEKALKEAREAALKDLIDRRLIIQAFKKEKYEIPDHFVEEQVRGVIKESFGGDRNTFIKTLEAQSYSIGEFKQKETERMIVQAMRAKNVKRNPITSPTKVEEYYKKHRAEFTAKEQVKLRMIMIPGHADTGQSATQKALAEEVLGQLAGGAEFERIAQTYSEDGTRDVGGDWGWIERKTLAPPLEKIAFNMPVGRISNIIEYGGNYYILKVEERQGGRPVHSPKHDLTSRRNYSRRKHKISRNAGSPVCAQKLIFGHFDSASAVTLRTLPAFVTVYDGSSHRHYAGRHAPALALRLFERRSGRNRCRQAPNMWSSGNIPIVHQVCRALRQRVLPRPRWKKRSH